MTEGRARTVFIGSGVFGQPALEALDDNADVELVGVVTVPPRPAGRHGRPTQTPIHDRAQALGVTTVLTPERLRSPEATAAVLVLEPDLIVLADYGQIVPRTLLEVRHGALNLHPSLLPRHRGATPIPATILAGDEETGVTLMRMDEGLDTGPIVAQEVIPLRGDEVTPDLEATLAAMAAQVIDTALGPWLRGELDAHPQPEEGATLTKPLRRVDGRLDVSRSPTELERQVRAYQPWPGTFVDTLVGRLIVWRAQVSTGRPPIGTFDLEGLGVGDGKRLRLIEVQPAGGMPMSWEAFVRGRPTIVGSSIVR